MPKMMDRSCDPLEIDKLTGLYTREAFLKYADEKIKNNPGVRFNIVISDFVNFKHFNERYGTEAGDLLLKRTGEMLQLIDPDIIAGRYSADRFVTLMRHIGVESVQFLEDFRLPPQAALELPTTSITVKFGVCDDVDHDKPVSVSCDHAYIALQSVKHNYKKNVGVYNEDLGRSVMEELIIEENMKNALDERQFVVYYQPKMDVETNKICGAEALVRWIHPELGFMNPGTFIPIFEKNGFITEMDLYVWKEVCRSLDEWKIAGLDPVPVSSNVSRIDFDTPDLAEKITAIVDSYGLDHSLFHIELTESACSDNSAAIFSIISKLHDAGFVIELDDFGAGYTSLSSLSELEYDILKFDMSLLKKDKPSSDKTVLTVAMQLAQMMNLKVIQEGVETAEQLERLKSLGCVIVQGFYYSKPLPKDEFVEFMKNHR